jgi:hypothetical protein
MTEPQKSLEDRIRAAGSSQEISDLQKEQSHWVERQEGSVPAVEKGPWTSVTQPGRVRIHSNRDGDVDLPVEMLPRAVEIDPNLVVIGIGANAELQRQISECTDPSRLQHLLGEMNRKQK